jgi:hypothetical protein
MSPDEELLRRLEESLWRPETRFDRDYLDGLLADGFFEFGRSGRVYGREEVLASPAGSIDAVLPLPDLDVRRLAEDVALVTYTSATGTDPVQRAHRSSLWRRGFDGWRIEFHQGTPFDTLTGDDRP